MWLDVKQTQHAGAAFDVHSSLISIEAAGGPVDALPSAARRICRLVRSQDSIVLLDMTCALLLPGTPFSGAQALASRLAPLLSGFHCELHVYHGATALLVLQRLREAGARQISPDECDDPLSPAPVDAAQARQAERAENAVAPLPYLAFLTDYPSLRLLHLFPYELACRYQCVPVGTERRMLTLATCHWLNREVVAQLRTATRRDIFQVRCELTIIDEVLRYWQRVQAPAAHGHAELCTDELCSPSR